MNILLKNFLKTATILFLFVAFNSCKEDESLDMCYFTLGIGLDEIYGGSDYDTNYNDSMTIKEYRKNVFKSYTDALGMTEDNNTIVVKGDFVTASNNMKKKFDSVIIPDRPQLTSENSSYTLTLTLSGDKLGEDNLQTISTKIISNGN